MPKVIAPTDIKYLLGNLSRPNYYQMNFSIPLIGGLSGYLALRGVDPYFINNEVGLLCNAASLPGSNLATTESYNFHGNKETMAHTLMYDSLRLEFYCDNSYKTLKFFEHWIGFIASGGGVDLGQSNYSRELRYPDEYKSNACKLYKFENDNRSVDATSLNITRFIDYSFVGLFPVDLFETPLNYGQGSGVTQVSVAFNYDRHIPGSINTIDILNLKNNNFIPLVANTIDRLNNGLLSSFIN